MTDSQPRPSRAGRLDFLTVLGLAPPVTVEDVKQAYLEKVKTAHPDHGGDQQQFVRVHEAYEKATEYARFKAGRMQWLSRWVEQYAEQQQAVAEIQALGGKVEFESIDWATQSIGNDFATVLERIIAINFSGPTVDDQTLAQLGARRRMLLGVQRLALVETKITSAGLKELHSFDSLHHLDLSGTRVELHDLQLLLPHLDRLESLVLRDSGIGWPSRLQLRLSHRGLTILS